MADLTGIWTSTMEAHGMRVETTHAVREDGGCQTRMVYEMPDGARRTILHDGVVEVSDATFRVHVHAGWTEVSGAPDPAENFEMRAFTPEEFEETKTMLDQNIGYAIEGDTLVTQVQGPGGAMEVRYQRQG